MRVALWHTTLPESGRKPGGVDVAVHGLANGLANTGDDKITDFSLSPHLVDAAYQHKQLFADAQWLRRNALTRFFILPLLLNLVKFRGFDVLHLHGDDWFYLRRTLPTVHTLHGSALRDSEEQLWTVFVLTVWLHLPAGKLSCGDGLEALGE
jgi:phosphatidyl-myo-inositol alpha-mannosyltransferase